MIYPPGEDRSIDLFGLYPGPISSEESLPVKRSKLGSAVAAALLPALAVLLMSATDASAHGVPLAEQQRLIDGGNIAYLRSGAVHMLTGYDHLLFLAGVVFFLTSTRDIVRFVTAFTIGHSITLLAATLLGIQANYFLIDAVIALSVIYKGFDNLDGFRKTLGVASPNLVWMVFGFGLVHGFGLSTRLQQLPLPTEGLVWRILSFNAGVELGQIAALLVILAVITAWRRFSSFRPFSIAANAGLVAAGGLLFLMQMHGYQHTQFPDELGFSEDGHAHAHEEMERLDLEARRKGRDSLN